MEAPFEDGRPDDARVRAEAREHLAHELHDELTHRVASISLQVMAHRDSTDASAVGRALDSIGSTTADVLAHLWLLGRVLRAHPFDPAREGLEPGLAQLSVCEPVAVLVEARVASLRAAGFQVTAEVPAETEHVGVVARRTFAEALLAAHDVVSEHGVPGGPCSIEVTLSPGILSLRVHARLARWSKETVPPTLVALHERIRLSEGALWVAERPDTASWAWSLSARVRDA